MARLMLEVLIVGLLFGAIAGAIAVEVLLAQPARRERDALFLADCRRRRLEAHDRLAQAVWRRDHLGTPYAPDLHNGSRKAPDLRSVK